MVKEKYQDLHLKNKQKLDELFTYQNTNEFFKFDKTKYQDIDFMKNPEFLRVVSQRIYWKFPFLIKELKEVYKTPGFDSNDVGSYYIELLEEISLNIYTYLNEANTEYTSFYNEVFDQMKTQNFFELNRFLAKQHLTPLQVYREHLNQIFNVMRV